MTNFAELGAASNFSFLYGASHPEELVGRAHQLGLCALSLADRNTVAGVVRGHMAAKQAGMAFHPGCRLVFRDRTSDILVWPRNLAGWNRLCRLLTIGNRRAVKGQCHLDFADLLEHGADMAIALVPGEAPEDEIIAQLSILAETHTNAVRIAVSHHYGAITNHLIKRIEHIAETTNLPLLATNDVLYHCRSRRQLQDVLTCIRTHTTLDTAGRLLAANAERHLKSPPEMAQLFARRPDALGESVRLASELNFSLDELRYQYPDEAPENGLSSQQELARLARQGAYERYPDGVPQKVWQQIEHELELIGQLQYAPYFLTVYDVVRFARSRKILCQGRGSAANSTICYCIGITDVDPEIADLLFERFISPERREPPDIDVDFEHERREEVIQYIYGKYGRERSGLVATVITYRARSAAREVGKAFGLSQDAIGALASSVWGHSSSSLSAREAGQGGLDIADKTVGLVLELATQINGFPRHLSQHSGGFVITRDRLDHIMPVMNTAMEDRTQVEWDKDDLESLGILKIDILALGMLTCLRKAFDLLDQHYRLPMTLASMPKEDRRTYDMICRADTVGVFQIESRAQMSMLPRLRPRTFYDLVIEVAIVRPGPIQGDMVHPYLRRRQGKEKVSYPSRELEAVLGKTLGVPLFQEQAMKIAIVAAGFSPGEADKLRRAMATFRRVGTIHTFQEKMIEGMAANGYERDFAERCFRQIEGFGEYGFPESHAASFALLVYASCWLKCHYPDVYAAAILNSQPMGFYSASQLVRDAREHGITVLPPDINWSDYDGLLEPSDFDPETILKRNRDMAGDIRSTQAVRLGLRQIKGIGRKEGEILMEKRDDGYLSVRDLWLRTGLSRKAIEQFADADAFRSLGLDRRAALWAVRALDPVAASGKLPLFDTKDGHDPQNEPETHLPAMPPGEHVIQDYRRLSLSLKGHPVSFVRAELNRQGVVKTADLDNIDNGRRLSIAGLVVVRQRPGSAKGVVFMTLEDETGIANVIVWPKVLEKFRAIVLGCRFVRVSGRLQKADNVTHLVADRIEDRTTLLATLTEEVVKPPFAGGLANADEVARPVQEVRERNGPRARLARLLKETPDLKSEYRRVVRDTSRVLPKGRNFH